MGARGRRKAEAEVREGEDVGEAEEGGGSGSSGEEGEDSGAGRPRISNGRYKSKWRSNSK